MQSDPAYLLYREISALLWARDHARSVEEVTRLDEQIRALQEMIQRQQAA
jgi:hypothetical protein